MFRLFQTFAKFVNNMDAKAMTSLSVSLVLLVFVILMMLYGRETLGLDTVKIQELMARTAESPFAIIGVISVFCLLALTGFPQTLLIAGTVVVFGAQAGGVYAWVATMSSATLTFLLGVIFGGGLVRRLSPGRAQSMIATVQRNGVLASLMVRLIPSAPFIVINAICGAARINVLKYWLGTGAGIVPKIFFISVLGGQVDAVMNFFTSRNPKDLLVIAVIIVAWLSFLMIIRRLYLNRILKPHDDS